jgi:hypothetical protein
LRAHRAFYLHRFEICDQAVAIAFPVQTCICDKSWHIHMFISHVLFGTLFDRHNTLNPGNFFPFKVKLNPAATRFIASP